MQYISIPSQTSSPGHAEYRETGIQGDERAQWPCSGYQNEVYERSGKKTQLEVDKQSQSTCRRKRVCQKLGYSR